MFQQVTEVFHLQTLIGSSPRATVFQASFCFLLYNMTQVIQAMIAEGADREVKTISLELLFYDVQRQLTAWTEVLPPRQTVELLSTTWTPSQVTRRLGQLLHGAWSERWIKSPSNTHKKTAKQRDEYPIGGHTSVFRVMQEPARDSDEDVYSSGLGRPSYICCKLNKSKDWSAAENSGSGPI